MAQDPQAPVLRSDGASDEGSQVVSDINQQFKERDIRQQARTTGDKYIDLKNAPLNHDALRLATWEQVQQAQAIPFEVSGKQLHVAAVDPNGEVTQAFLNPLREKGYEIELYTCSAEGIASTEHFFANFFSKESVDVEKNIVEESGVSSSDVSQLFEPYRQVFETGTGPDMTNKLSLLAIQFRASDVHFQPEEEEVMIRMRRDGQLYEVFRFPLKQYTLLAGEIKRSAGMKMNVSVVPQDGDYEFIVNERKVSVRVSSLPSKYGESIVLRILDAQNAIVELDSLGFSDHAKALIEQYSQKEKGLILVTGPTGSGKTSTLYSVLNKVNTADKKIITLEDPIEFELKNIIQSQINESEDFTFADGLRSILRQDPDIIMVGEIRDKEAAEIALQASLTGHLVLSTLHSNDAIATLPRLLNMGVKAYILSAGIELVIAQRLVRRICPDCKQPGELSQSQKEEIDHVIQSLGEKGVTIPEQKISSAKGCESCSHTGYQGRMVIAEVLPITDALRVSLGNEASAQDILKQASGSGFITMKEDGILKALSGETTLEEVWKVLV